MSESKDDARELKAESQKTIPAPELPYQAPVPKTYKPAIALIGCGGIAQNHLEAYQAKGYDVVTLCSRRKEAAEALRDRFYPDAKVCTDPKEIFSDKHIEVVDITSHPAPRVELMRDALLAGKHVLSQKPFVTQISTGQELVNLAAERNLKLAVNQNGRWAPYFSYLRQVIKEGLLGDITSCDIQIAWDHSWIEGTEFEKVQHIVLYDFGIHWFDMLCAVFGERDAHSVFAQVAKSPGQTLTPAMNAQAVVQFENGLGSLSFRALNKFDPKESMVVTGTKGTFRSSGPVCANDEMTLSTKEGIAHIELEGAWFNDGFAGAMGELLCAIEEEREPENSARGNLKSLALCFAAAESANTGLPVKPGDVRSIDV